MTWRQLIFIFLRYSKKQSKDQQPDASRMPVGEDQYLADDDDDDDDEGTENHDYQKM